MILLFDGVCGLCNRVVRFVAARDRRGLVRFAPLQGGTARGILERHGRDTEDFDSVVVVQGAGTPDERLLFKGRAVVALCRVLPWPWRAGLALRWLPERAQDALYDFVAARRYRWFGRLDACPVPDEELKKRFVE